MIVFFQIQSTYCLSPIVLFQGVCSKLSLKHCFKNLSSMLVPDWPMGKQGFLLSSSSIAIFLEMKSCFCGHDQPSTVPRMQ